MTTKSSVKIKTGLALLAFLIMAFGCSAKGAANAPSFSNMSVNMQARTGFAQESDEAAIPEAGQDDYTERKLVKRANIRIRVENLDEADASISGLMEKYNAYAASTVIEEESRKYSIRVPSPVYDVFLAGMDGMGRTLGRTETAEDVTLRYYDLEGRLSTQRELLKTFQSYLGKANNIEEILSVEARIAELQNELEGTGRELRNLAGRVDFASVELYIIGPASSVPYRGPDFGERVRELFDNFGSFLSTVAIILVGIVIYGIPVLILLVFFFWLMFGRVGLVKKLWRAAAGRKKKPIDGEESTAQ